MTAYDLATEGGRGNFGKLYQRRALRIAMTGTGLSLDLRIMQAAYGQANNAGHAIFEEGELGRLCARDNGKAVSRSSLYTFLGKLRDAGMVLGESNPRCVWLPYEAWSRAVGGTAYCPVHRTRASGSVVSPEWRPEVA
jgi:hypothetical protein